MAWKFWHSILHIVLHSIWHLFWHSLYLAPILTLTLSGICSDIHSIWNSVSHLILTFSLTSAAVAVRQFALPPLVESGWRWLKKRSCYGFTTQQNKHIQPPVHVFHVYIYIYVYIYTNILYIYTYEYIHTRIVLISSSHMLAYVRIHNWNVRLGVFFPKKKNAHTHTQKPAFFLHIPYIFTLWRFPEMGGTPKSSIFVKDCPL